MIVRLSKAPKAADLSYPEFQAHWRSQHASAVLELPGLRRYVQNHSVLRDDKPLLTAVGYDAGAELDFDDVAAMEAAFNAPRQAEAIAQDQTAMIDRSGFGLALVEPTVVYSERPPGPAAVKLMLFVERGADDAGVHPGTPDRLLDSIAAAEPSPFRLEVLTPCAAAHPPAAPPFCEVAYVAWFDSADEGLGLWEGLAPSPGQRISPLLATAVQIA
jgi:uncharacterized protein (TIGR02118 family)